MRIARYFNTTELDILPNKVNFIIGISLGNKYFSREHIKEYILWSVDNAKEKVVVLIADKIHAINYEARFHYAKGKALKLAMKDGLKIQKTIDGIIGELPQEKQIMVEVVHWEEIEDQIFKHNFSILEKAFKTNVNFRDTVFAIVKEAIKSGLLSELDYEQLCTYPISELPIFLNGFDCKGIVYDAQIYPGVSKIDYLTDDLGKGKVFSEITKNLIIKHKLKIIEAYAE